MILAQCVKLTQIMLHTICFLIPQIARPFVQMHTSATLPHSHAIHAMLLAIHVHKHPKTASLARPSNKVHSFTCKTTHVSLLARKIHSCTMKNVLQHVHKAPRKVHSTIH